MGAPHSQGIRLMADPLVSNFVGFYALIFERLAKRSSRLPHTIHTPETPNVALLYVLPQ
jgi:hypothetical protein